MTNEKATNSFCNGELEAELRRIGKEDVCIKYDKDREQCFEMVQDVRRKSVYAHPPTGCMWLGFNKSVSIFPPRLFYSPIPKDCTYYAQQFTLLFSKSSHFSQTKFS